jgi:hypothetical protein
MKLDCYPLDCNDWSTLIVPLFLAPNFLLLLKRSFLSSMHLLPTASYINHLSSSSLLSDDVCSSKTSQTFFVTIGIKLNASAEWLAVLLHVWEVLGSNLGPETGYPEVFGDFPQSLQVDAGTVF